MTLHERPIPLWLAWLIGQVMARHLPDRDQYTVLFVKTATLDAYKDQNPDCWGREGGT